MIEKFFLDMVHFGY